MENNKVLNISIVGGGLVGSACACFMAKRGHHVNLYEYRGDMRKMKIVPGRSINLAMSTRAQAALKTIGLEDHMVNEHGIAMKGRMIHNLNGSKYPIYYDPRTNQCLYSVGRKHLNEVLLTAAEKYDNLKLHFNHKLINANLEDGKITLLQTETNQTIEVKSDLIIGADGAFSAIRRSMMKRLFDFSQTYIEHGYLELCIPPKDKKFTMEENYLHIWPRGEFMMIALPNQDLTWTVSLFMPFATFQSLDSPKRLLQFFRNYFPDSIPLIGENNLIADFFKVKPSPLVSIKCSPYHVDDKALIIGDAAHAMVPFYGQGMNAGFEDCSILDSLMEEYGTDLKLILSEFTRRRQKDAQSICDLAMYNYIEMRDLVNKNSYLWRKKIDDFLFWLVPDSWVPLYNSVSFSRMGYRQCIENRKWQDKIVKRILCFILIIFILFVGLIAWSYDFNVTDIVYAQKVFK